MHLKLNLLTASNQTSHCANIAENMLVHCVADPFKGGYMLYFQFYFKGKKLDTINVSHYCKIIEDKLLINNF